MLFIGPEAERRFGRRHFMDMTAVFTAPPEFTVLPGGSEIGRTDPSLLTAPSARPAAAAARAGGAGGSPTSTGRAGAASSSPRRGGRKGPLGAPAFGGTSFALARAMREVLLGADPPVRLTRRAVDVLAADA